MKITDYGRSAMYYNITFEAERAKFSKDFVRRSLCRYQLGGTSIVDSRE